MPPENWSVSDEVYPPREDSKLLASVLARQDFSGKRVLDMGTGSGIQAYTVVQQGAQRVTAVDVNPDALEDARENLERSGVDLDTVTFVESDLFEAVDDAFDVIVFNPPYVPGEKELGTREETSWAGGKEGREVIDRFLDGFDDHLGAEGQVFLLQSSLNDAEKTVNRFEEQGFAVEVVAEKKIPWEKLLVLCADGE